VNTSGAGIFQARIPAPVATLTLGVQDVFSPEGRALAEECEALAFSPWNALAEHRSMGGHKPAAPGGLSSQPGKEGNEDFVVNSRGRQDHLVRSSESQRHDLQHQCGTFQI
jgi:hypothetical protein